jgi:hypothetical protein
MWIFGVEQILLTLWKKWACCVVCTDISRTILKKVLKFFVGASEQNTRVWSAASVLDAMGTEFSIAFLTVFGMVINEGGLVQQLQVVQWEKHASGDF